MVEVHAPIHITRKSRCSNALKTRRSKVNLLLRKRMGPLNQVQQIAFTIREKHQAMPLRGRIGFHYEGNIFGFETLIGRVKILDGDGHVAQSGVIHLLRDSIVLCGDDFENRPIVGLYEIVSVVLIDLAKFQMVDVPLREVLRGGARNGHMLHAGEHCGRGHKARF